jgi:hypothetical protein
VKKKEASNQESKKLEKEEQIKSKAKRRKEIVK